MNTLSRRVMHSRPAHATLALLLLLGGASITLAQAPAAAVQPLLSQEQLDHIRTLAQGILFQLAGQSPEVQDRVVRQYVLNEFAMASRRPGASTTELGPELTRQADDLLRSILGSTPAPPPEPAPAPEPQPAPEPAPAPQPRPTPGPPPYILVPTRPVIYVIRPQPVVVPAVYVPMQPLYYPVQPVAPAYYLLRR